MSEVAGPSERVTSAWAELDGGFETEPGASGLLHQTIRLNTASGAGFVLQRVSDVFAPEIHENIRAVTEHLAGSGVETFRLVPTRAGRLFVDLGADGRWRLLTRLPGITFDRVTSSGQARSAGALVGRFHAVLGDFEAPLAPMGLPFRETDRYRAALAESLRQHAGHPRYADVSGVRDEIEAGFAALGPPPATRSRVIHADLKISNVLFADASPAGREEATALIDFDTLMRAPLWSEWGDAWRSWCNRRGEDETDAEFDLDVFAASIEGFGEGFGEPLAEVERASLLDATERLALELATRYVEDVFAPSYWGWDPERFPDAASHNFVRAQGQLALYRSARASRAERAEILANAVAVEGRP